MISFRDNYYDFKNKCNRKPLLIDITVDGTRVATLRTQRQAVKFRAKLEANIGYPCRSGTQQACFEKYYRAKYGNSDINV